jgi:hypothetical protein
MLSKTWSHADAVAENNSSRSTDLGLSGTITTIWKEKAGLHTLGLVELWRSAVRRGFECREEKSVLVVVVAILTKGDGVL